LTSQVNPTPIKWFEQTIIGVAVIKGKIHADSLGNYNRKWATLKKWFMIYERAKKKPVHFM